MELNVVSFAYLFLTLSPFVIACYFTLTSFFDQDFKGVVYLAGLIGACFLGVFLGNSNALWFIKPQKPSGALCSMISINQIGEISRLLPLGPIILAYTFAYLLVPIINYDFVMQNTSAITFFIVLILFDIIWRIRNSCQNLSQLLGSLTVGGVIGILWSSIINSSNSKNLAIIPGLNSKSACSVPKHPKFKCTQNKKPRQIVKPPE
jgi:hypothetical protein